MITRVQPLVKQILALQRSEHRGGYPLTSFPSCPLASCQCLQLAKPAWGNIWIRALGNQSVHISCSRSMAGQNVSGWVGKDISRRLWWGASPLALWSSCQQRHRTAAMNTGRVSNIAWQWVWCSQTKVKHSNSFLLTLTTCETSTTERPLWEQKLKVQITIFWNNLNFKAGS